MNPSLLTSPPASWCSSLLARLHLWITYEFTVMGLVAQPSIETILGNSSNRHVCAGWYSWPVAPQETSGPLEDRVAFLVAFSWNWSWLTCGKKGWFLESWQRLLSYFLLLPWFGLGGSLPNPLLDLHILSLPNKGWPCHTIVAKWTPTRGHLKKKEEALSSCLESSCVTRLRWRIYKPRFSWGSKPVAGKPICQLRQGGKRERAWILAHFVEVLH